MNIHRLAMDPLRNATTEVSKRTPYQPHPSSRIRHVSPQTQFLIQQIVSSLNTFRQDPADIRVLLCGDAADLRRIVDAISAAVDDNAFILSRIIVAIEDIVPFAHELLEISKPQIVEWNEADYEEYLIERVKRRTDNFVIGLAIDLSPSIRRVRRMRQLLEKDGTLIIPNEGKGWRTAYPELLGSFVVDGGRFLTMVDCVPGVAESIRDSELFLPLDRRICPQPGIIDLREATHHSGPRGM
ncbi:hypothetical protein ACTXT7_003614 [Hymenolepis weldensis]